MRRNGGNGKRERKSGTKIGNGKLERKREMVVNIISTLRIAVVYVFSDD